MGPRNTYGTKCGRTTCAGSGKKPTTPSSAKSRPMAAVAAVPLQSRIVRQRARKMSLASGLNCMSWEKYKLFIKAMEWEKYKAMGKGKESSAVADKGQHELKRETAKETEARLSEWLTQKRWEPCRPCVVRTDSPTSSQHKDVGVPCFVRTDSPTSSLHKDVGVQCILPLKRIGFSKSKGEGKGKGKGMGDGPEPVWPIEAGEAHEIKSCDTGTLRYRADIPLNERRGGASGDRPSSQRSCTMGQFDPQ